MADPLVKHMFRLVHFFYIIAYIKRRKIRQFLTCNSVAAWFWCWVISFSGVLRGFAFRYINDAMTKENHSL